MIWVVNFFERNKLFIKNFFLDWPKNIFSQQIFGQKRLKFQVETILGLQNILG